MVAKLIHDPFVEFPQIIGFNLNTCHCKSPIGLHIHQIEQSPEALQAAQPSLVLPPQAARLRPWRIGPYQVPELQQSPIPVQRIHHDSG